MKSCLLACRVYRRSAVFGIAAAQSLLRFSALVELWRSTSNSMLRATGAQSLDSTSLSREQVISSVISPPNTQQLATSFAEFKNVIAAWKDSRARTSWKSMFGRTMKTFDALSITATLRSWTIREMLISHNPTISMKQNQLRILKYSNAPLGPARQVLPSSPETKLSFIYQNTILWIITLRV